MFDLNRTLQLINGALFDAPATWQNYREEAGDWQKTAWLLTGPLIIASAVVAYVLGFVGVRSPFSMMLLGIVSGAISIGIASFIFSAFAGTFGGKPSFALGLAALTLAAVPAYVGSALAPLPLIGWLLSIGLGIYSLVLLWRIIPVYLEVPDEKRVIHYIVSLICCFVVTLVLSAALIGMFGMTPEATFERNADEQSTLSDTGFFGGIIQQAEFLDSVQQDQYQPPEDGRLSEQQVLEFIRVMERTSEVAAERGERLQTLGQRMEEDQQVSLSDLGALVQGVNQASQLNTTEIEIVKA